MRVDRTELESLAKQGLVGLVRHPEVALTIANYTQKAQYDRSWKEYPVLLDCRGLIFDDSGAVVAKGFRKFFNLGEIEQKDLPPEAPEVSEKLDGSLAITYPCGRRLRIATRGAFESTQAAWASVFMERHYGDRKFDADLTYLFEIIYPENRIVVNYGVREELVLIGAVVIDGGREFSYAETRAEAERLGLPGVELFDSVPTTPKRNFEGYVLFWPRTQQRVKVKLPEYLELHRLVTDFSAKRVWEAIKEGAFDRMIENAPDEVFGWARMIQGELQQQFEALQDRVELATGEAQRRFSTRKEQAQWVMANHSDISGAVFRAIDQRPYSVMLWNMLEPAADAGRFGWKAEDAE